MEKLEIWNLSRQLCKDYGSKVLHIKNFEMRNQMVRSMISIISNIAEGYGRQSPKDYIRFLRIAVGSLNEFESQCHVSYDLSLLDKDCYDSILPELSLIRKKVLTLIRVIKKTHGV